MADNVAITAGSGTSIATDDVGGVHYQVVKTAFGALDSITLPQASVGYGFPTAPSPYSTAHLVTAASANPTSVKASAGILRTIIAFNVADYPIYIKFHNTAGTPTAGSGVVFAVGIQAGVGLPIPVHRSFTTGIGMTVVKDLADAGTTAVAASDAVIEVLYE